MNPTAPLSPREKSVIELASLGLPDKAIAEQLECSPHTVKTHWRRAFLKLDVHSRGAAIFKLLSVPVTQTGDPERATCAAE